MARSKSVANTAADPTVQYTRLTLDGKTYQLVFDFNALAKAEQLTGLDMLKSARFEGLTASEYRALLWAAMQKAHPVMSLDNVGALLSLPNLRKITDALLESYGVSLPEPEPETVTDPNEHEPETMVVPA